MAYEPDDELKQAQFLADLYNKQVDTSAQPQIDIYNRQIQGAAQQFNPYRNAIEVQSRVDAKTLAEQMANAGLQRSGTNLTAQTALATGKQNAQTAVNKQQGDYTQQIRDQLANIIAQKEASKQQNLATTTAQAFQNVSQWNQSTTMAEINQKYNIAAMHLEDELATAREDNNWAREVELTRQQAELNRQHDIAVRNLDNQAAMARQKASSASSGGPSNANTKQATAYGKELANSIKAVSEKDAQYNKENLTNINNKNNAEHSAVTQIIRTYGNDPASFEAAITSAGLLTYWTQIAANPSVQASMIDQALYPEKYKSSNRGITR